MWGVHQHSILAIYDKVSNPAPWVLLVLNSTLMQQMPLMTAGVVLGLDWPPYLPQYYSLSLVELILWATWDETTREPLSPRQSWNHESGSGNRLVLDLTWLLVLLELPRATSSASYHALLLSTAKLPLWSNQADKQVRAIYRPSKTMKLMVRTLSKLGFSFNCLSFINRIGSLLRAVGNSCLIQRFMTISSRPAQWRILLLLWFSSPLCPENFLRIRLNKITCHIW